VVGSENLWVQRRAGRPGSVVEVAAGQALGAVDEVIAAAESLAVAGQ